MRKIKNILLLIVAFVTLTGCDVLTNLNEKNNTVNSDNSGDDVSVTKQNEKKTVLKPYFSNLQGQYLGEQYITISTETDGANIRFTLDGTEPSESNGTIYNGGIFINETKTLKAIAYKDNYNPSEVNSALYSIIVWKGELDSAPDNPVADWGYYDKRQKMSFTYDGTKWNIYINENGNIESFKSIKVTANDNIISKGDKFNFGTLEENVYSRKQTFTIENTTDQNLIISVIGNSFRLIDNPTVYPYIKNNVTVVFTPSSENITEHEGYIIIHNPATPNNFFYIFLKGTGKAGFIVKLSDSFIPNGSTYDLGTLTDNEFRKQFVFSVTNNSGIDLTPSQINPCGVTSVSDMKGGKFFMSSQIPSLLKGQTSNFTLDFTAFTSTLKTYYCSIWISFNNGEITYFSTFKVSAKNNIAENYKTLPDSDLSTDIRMEGSFISWGGFYTDPTTDTNCIMKKLNYDTYIKLITIDNNASFIPSSYETNPYYTVNPKKATGCFVFKYGNQLGPNYGAMYATDNLISLGDPLLLKYSIEDESTNNIHINLERGKTYLFILSGLLITVLEQ